MQADDIFFKLNICLYKLSKNEKVFSELIIIGTRQTFYFCVRIREDCSAKSMCLEFFQF